jgi:hypothetical protein
LLAAAREFACSGAIGRVRVQFGVRPDGIVIDIDATLIDAHTEEPGPRE